MPEDGSHVLNTAPEDGPWVSMRRACEILGVNQSTLRVWTDSGRVPVFLTPGGHRRYRESDLRALSEVGGGVPVQSATQPLSTALLASHERYETVARRALQSSPWFRRFDDDARRRFRMLGPSMLGLLTTYVVATSRTERERCLLRGRELAAEYGGMASCLGLTVAEATEAFLLFRNPVLEVVHQWLGSQPSGQRQAAETLRRVNYFMDHMLVSLATAHEQAHGGSPAQEPS
ncbi:MAG: helix-turn-helix domain-containing protein [Chloroflexi bacterium]|nr:helix-turn-helix domain-containing protein [Chloroflexota bacterium]